MNLIIGSGCASASDDITTKALSLLLDDTRLSTISQVIFLSLRLQWTLALLIEEGKGFLGIHWIARFGLLPLLEQWIERKYKSDQRNSSGRAPLSWAVASGHEATKKLLLDTGKVDVDSKDNYGRTPLSWAAENGHEAIVKILLDISKVDVNSKDKFGRTPLSFTASRGQETVMKLLLDTGKVDVDSRDLASRIRRGQVDPTPKEERRASRTVHIK
jgi:hypothetical protein